MLPIARIDRAPSMSPITIDPACAASEHRQYPSPLHSLPHAPVSGGFDNSARCRLAQAIPAINPKPNNTSARNPSLCSIDSVSNANAATHVVPIPREIRGPLSRTKITKRLTIFPLVLSPYPSQLRRGFGASLRACTEHLPQSCFRLSPGCAGREQEAPKSSPQPQTLFSTS